MARFSARELISAETLASLDPGSRVRAIPIRDPGWIGSHVEVFHEVLGAPTRPDWDMHKRRWVKRRTHRRAACRRRWRRRG